MGYSNTVLQNVAFEIERDRQSEAERMRMQRLLGVQKNSDPAFGGRPNISQRRQGFVPTHKFYRSRRK